MALWICRLDSNTWPAANLAPRASGIRGWLLKADLNPAGLQQPSEWELYQRYGEGLPFGLDLRLVKPFSPAQERQIATQIAPWLAAEDSLRLHGLPILLLRGAKNFSHPCFGPRSLRFAINNALGELGCPLAVLLLCWAHDPIDNADAVIDGVAEEPEGTPRNYEVFLRDAHHREWPAETWRIPAVVAPADPERSRLINASAERYQEWLALESKWSEFWLEGSEDAPVVLGSWAGHQRWWHEPQNQTPAADKGKAPASTNRLQETQWGTQQQHHLALILHGFHERLLGEILEQLPPGGGCNGLPEIDLYLTVPEALYEPSIYLLKRAGWPRVHVFAVANRGRDVAPFLLKALPAASTNQHQYFLKIHTKSSAHLADGTAWGSHLINSLLAPEFLQQLHKQLVSNSRLGLIAPAGTVLPCSLALHRNSSHLLSLCQRHGLAPRAILKSRFIAGTMMAGRMEVLEPLLEHAPLLNAFESEAGQTDGTLAHAYERWLGIMAEHNGWQIEEVKGNAAAVPNFGYGWAQHPADAHSLQQHRQGD